MDNLTLQAKPKPQYNSSQDGLAQMLMNNIMFNGGGNADYQGGGVRIGSNENHIGIKGSNSSQGLALQEAMFRKQLTDQLSMQGSYSPSHGNMGQQYGGINFQYKI